MSSCSTSLPSWSSLDVGSGNIDQDALSSSTASLTQTEVLSSDEIRSITAALSRNQEEVVLGAVQVLNQMLQKNRAIRSVLARQDPPIILQRLAQLMPVYLGLDIREIIHCRDWGVIPLIKENCSLSSTEKIIRIGLSIFKNLLIFAKQETASLLVGCKVFEWINHLASLKRYSDEEMLSDIQFLQSELSAIYQNLSSFDQYATEIRSGLLSWTPPHRSDVFWKMNVNYLLDNDRDLLRRLILHLGDPSVLVKAVAVHDLGQFVKFHPEGKRILEECNGKVPMMSLLACPDPNVKFEALTAVQKYMLQMSK